MIQLRMSVTDLERMRFAYSPLTEVAESLYMVHSGWIDPLYRGWFTMTREKLRRADSAVLRAVVPARGYVANVLLGGTADVTTTIEQQLQLVADCPADQLRADLEGVWRGGDLPPAAQSLLTRGGGRRLADALFQYWQLAIEPHWTQLRALLDADVVYRAGRLARGGIEAMMSDLHPDLELAEYAIQIVGRRSSEHDLTGTGLLLIPCVFAWPHIIVDPGRSGPPSLTYGPRGIGALWETRATAPAGDDALGTLLGRSRAAILSYLTLPRSTSDLARELGQSPPGVSAHLSILRRCGLVTSWRSGRRVLYQRTPLASSVVAASSAAAGTAPDNPVNLEIVPDAGRRAASPP
jgi:DNA-binding transcriptional ArsR family regulator